MLETSGRSKMSVSHYHYEEAPEATQNSNRLLISVIMNCYNSSRYLREAIDSVFCQTYTNWEIIFWDNRSIDESAGIFKAYSSDPRCRYFLAQEHTTLGKARNLAVEQSRGEWVAFLDCDDMWLPEKLEKQVEIISEEGAELGLVYGQMQVLLTGNKTASRWTVRMSKYTTKNLLSRLPEGDIFESLLTHNFIPLVTAMVRRSAYIAVGGINPDYKQAEDYDLFLKISRDHLSRAVQGVVGIYRVHGANATQTQQEIGYLEAISVVECYLPLPAARHGLSWWYSQYAVNMLRKGRLREGVWLLHNHGDLKVFFEAILKYLSKIGR